MQVKTTNVEQLWQSTDGKRTIWEVVLKDQGGSEYRLKTYSPAIASLGFNGEVESYFARSGDRFVRQKRPAAATAKATGYQRDDNAIRAQWAIGQAINLAAVKMDKTQITLPVIEEYAKELFATVSRVKGEPVTPRLKQDAEQYVSGGLKAMPAV
jgi:hypothetical protein